MVSCPASTVLIPEDMALGRKGAVKIFTEIDVVPRFLIDKIGRQLAEKNIAIPLTVKSGSGQTVDASLLRGFREKVGKPATASFIHSVRGPRCGTAAKKSKQNKDKQEGKSRMHFEADL